MNKNVYGIIAIVSSIMYLKGLAKSKGGTLKGTVGPIKINPSNVVDKVMPWLNLNPKTSFMIQGITRNFLDGFVGVDDSDTIDAEYKEVK